MSNVIQFLESLGSRPAPSPAAYAATVAALDVEPAATRLAEDCRVRIARIDTRDSGHAFAITASFGVSASSMSGYDLSRLLSHADLMLYRAKREGRNRVFAYAGADAPVVPTVHVVTPITGDKPVRSVGS